MDQKMIGLADAVARAFKEQVTDAKQGKEALLIQVSSDFGFFIPNPKMDKKSWDEFTSALKYRHKLEALHKPSEKQSEIIVCAYGWLSGAPMITDADVDTAIAAFAVAEEVASQQYDDLMKRMQSK